MLWTIFVILIVGWALGLVSGYTVGNFIHVLLVVALVVLVFQLLTGRRSVPKARRGGVRHPPDSPPARLAQPDGATPTRGVVYQSPAPRR